MAREQRTFSAEPAVRHDTPLLIGLEGPPGGGKTYSALLLADGIRQVRGGDVYLIDTEGARSLAYADYFRFMHVNFEPPFRADAFQDAVQQQLVHKPAAIIVDSLSDEHEGEGGCLEWHDREIDRMLGNDKDNWKRREAVSQKGWAAPKAARVQMINAFMRIRTPLIFCFRAREKTKPMKQEKGDGREVFVPTNIGYQPICPAEIAHAMTVMCLLPPRSNGEPQWKSDSAMQDFLVKLPEQFISLFQTPGPLTRQHGRALAEWAAGRSADLEDEPLKVPLEYEQDGAPMYRAWGTRFAALVRNATSIEAIEAIEDANDETLKRMESDRPTLHKGLLPVLHEAKAKIEAGSAPIAPTVAEEENVEA